MRPPWPINGGYPPPWRSDRSDFRFDREKIHSRELGSEPLPEPIATFIDAEFDKGRNLFEGKAVRISSEAKHRAVAFFRETAKRFDAPRAGAVVVGKPTWTQRAGS